MPTQSFRRALLGRPCQKLDFVSLSTNSYHMIYYKYERMYTSNLKTNYIFINTMTFVLNSKRLENTTVFSPFTRYKNCLLSVDKHRQIYSINEIHSKNF